MSAKHKIEIFSAGCPACQEVVAEIKNDACAFFDVIILDMNDPAVAARAKSSESNRCRPW